MNENKNYLSLGNLFNLIKDNSYNKTTAMQSELFCALFQINYINNTTVNNYCIGYRAIGIEYKKIYIDLISKYKNDKYIFISIITNIISIMNEHVYKSDEITIDIINKNERLKKLCLDLHIISKNDININEELKDKLNTLMNNTDYYAVIIEFITYAILYNKQPVYIKKGNINLDKTQLDEYLEINLYEGISYITSLMELSKKGNVFANAELGSLEYSGLISGDRNLDMSFNYYLKAANKDHPKACWMVANIILKYWKETDYNIVFKYLNRAIKLGSLAALNTMGNCYLKGLGVEKNINKAIEYYKEAAESGYVFSYNNLGLIYEKKKDFKTAIEYYKISADLEESWALNKMGEYYRIQKQLDKAYFYYNKSIEAKIDERNFYAYYNIAKHFYLKDTNTYQKGIEYLKIAKNKGIKEASELLKKLI